MKVYEVFVGIQGEGRYMGQSGVFVRLAGCNLDCTACDTKQARSFRSGGYDVTPKRLAERIVSLFSVFQIRNVYITGGEPLLQADELEQFIYKTRTYTGNRFPRFILETNGTISPDEVRTVIEAMETIYVSPKPGHLRYLGKWAERDNVEFKVVCNPFLISDTAPAFKNPHAIVNRLIKLGVRRERIWLMPLGSSKEELERVAPRVWDIAIQLGVNYSDRLHIRVNRW